MKRTLVQYIAVAFLALALTARAAEEAPEQDRYSPLPDGIAAHLSFANAREFLDKAFAFTGEATKDTASYIPGELLSMAVNAYCPLPLDSWDVDNEAHVVFVGDFSKRPVRGPTPVFVFAYNTFDEFLAGLEKAHCTVGGKPADIGETGFADVREVSLMNGRTKFFLADLGTGRAVASENFEAATLVALHPDWEIEHLSGASVFARIAVPASGAGISEKLLEAFTGDAEALTKAVAELGLAPAIADWLLTTGKKYSGPVGDELEQAEELQVELDLDEGNAVLTFAARFAEGSWTRQWADTMDAADDLPDTGLTPFLPKGALTVAAAAPFAELVPDLQAIYAAFAPEFADAFFALNPGAGAGASYIKGGKISQLTIMKIDDATKALELLLDAFAATSGILERSFADASERVALVTEKQTDGEFEWYSLRLDPADAEKFSAFLARLNKMTGGRSLVIPSLDPDFRFYAAELGGMALVTLFGPVPQDEFAAILKGVAGTPEDAESPFTAPGVEKTLNSADGMQLSVALLDPDKAYAFYMGARGMSGLAEIFMEAKAKTNTLSAPAVVGFGGDDGNIVMSFVVPPGAVRAVIQNHELFKKVTGEAAKERTPE